MVMCVMWSQMEESVVVEESVEHASSTLDKSKFLVRLSRMALRIPKQQSHVVAKLLAKLAPEPSILFNHVGHSGHVRVAVTSFQCLAGNLNSGCTISSLSVRIMQKFSHLSCRNICDECRLLWTFIWTNMLGLFRYVLDMPRVKHIVLDPCDADMRLIVLAEDITGASKQLWIYCIYTWFVVLVDVAPSFAKLHWKW